MSLADPLALASFADLIRQSDVEFELSWSQQRAATAGGETLYADRAPGLWHARIMTPPMAHADAQSIKALINSRAGGLKTILLNDRRLPYPSSDPTGSLFGAATPVVGVITDRLHVAFTGFPNSYSIPRGTYFQVIFDTSRYYLGQFAEAKTAHVSTGAVTTVEIIPALPASVDPGDAVTVLKPSGKFRIVPNSLFPSMVETNFQRLTFAAEQTYTA
jgi:hypothetical protein